MVFVIGHNKKKGLLKMPLSEVQNSAKLGRNHPTYLQNIYFSDACIFFPNGNVHRQNCCYWSDSNPETHTKYP